MDRLGLARANFLVEGWEVAGRMKKAPSVSGYRSYADRYLPGTISGRLRHIFSGVVRLGPVYHGSR
jgi:hypothetical protein